MSQKPLWQTITEVAEKGDYVAFAATLSNGKEILFSIVVEMMDYLGEKWVVLEYQPRKQTYFVRFSDISMVEIKRN